MILTYRYRLKDRRAAKVLAQHRDILNRYRLGEAKRNWLTAFDLGKQCNGVGKELGIHQQTVNSVCEQWSRNRSIKFRSSFGQKRALGWVPFRQQTRQVDGNSITYLGKRFRWFGDKRRPLPETAKGGAFVEDATGRWYVTFQVEVVVRRVAATGEIGIDLGLKSLATISTGEIIENPRHLAGLAERLAIAQRSGNKRRATAIHAKIGNARRDFHHKLSTRLSREHAFIAVGDVNAKNLAKTRMAKSVLDAGWSTFRTMLAYKAGTFVLVDEKFTTQTCSCCGALPPERPKGIAGLGIREWECSECGTSHDRDVNAARNILALGRSAAPLVEESRRGRMKMGDSRIATP